METIHKLRLDVVNYQSVVLPEGSEILTVQIQKGTPCIWYKVKDTINSESRGILMYTTGKYVDKVEGKYIGSFQLYDGEFVAHVFEDV